MGALFRRSLAASSLVLVLALPLGARADEPNARVLATEGYDEFQRTNYAEALALFERAYRAEPSSRLSWGIGDAFLESDANDHVRIDAYVAGTSNELLDRVVTLGEVGRLEVKGTPTAFVNGHRIVGAQPIGTWLAEVDRALAKR